MAKYPEEEGSMLYFRVATIYACQCNDPNEDLLKMSWPNIQEGYENNNRMYGPIKQNKNRYAYFAFAFRDKLAAKQAFDAIGDDWDEMIFLIRLEEKEERRQFEVGAQGLWRESSGISLTHQIQLARTEERPGIYKLVPAVKLEKGEYALYLTRGEGMSPYVYDFSVIGVAYH